MAHTLVYLRIVNSVTRTAARLTTDLSGLALIERDSHPLGDEPNFKDSSHFPFPSAWPYQVASSGFSIFLKCAWHIWGRAPPFQVNPKQMEKPTNATRLRTIPLITSLLAAGPGTRAKARQRPLSANAQGWCQCPLEHR
jgi:hypothetical protein